MSNEENGAQPRSSIMGAAILAALLSTAGASGIGFALGDEITTPEMYAQHGSNGDGIFEFVVAGAIALGAALLVWLGFYLFVFRKRAKLWKALLALLAIVLVTALVATPVRIGTLVSHYMQDEDTVFDMRERDREVRREIRARLAPSMDGMRMDQGGPPLTRVQDLIDHRARLQDTLEKMRAYHIAMNENLAQSRAAVQAADIYSTIKEEGVAYYDERLTPDSNVQRHLTSTETILEKGIGFIDYLLAHRADWVIEDGTVAIMDRAVLEEVRRRGSELDEIGGELDHLQGAMGLEMGDEQPGGSPNSEAASAPNN
jgi:hypothetical protein